MKTKLFGFALGTVVTLAWLGCGLEESGTALTPDAGTASDDASTLGDGSTGTPGPDGDTPTDDAGTTPPTDAGKDSGPEDAGPLEFDSGIDAPVVDVQYGSCTTFAPCTSDPLGTWVYTTGGCVDALANDFCADAKISGIKVQGTMSYDGTKYAQDVATTGTVSVPGSCLEKLPIKNCALVEIGLTTPPPDGPGFDAAKCAANGTGGCTCSVAKKESRTGNYTIENGSTLRTDDNRTYDFCVQPADTLTYRDTSQGAAIPATLVLSKKP